MKLSHVHLYRYGWGGQRTQLQIPKENIKLVGWVLWHTIQPFVHQHVTFPHDYARPHVARLSLKNNPALQWYTGCDPYLHVPEAQVRQVVPVLGLFVITAQLLWRTWDNIPLASIENLLPSTQRRRSALGRWLHMWFKRETFNADLFCPLTVAGIVVDICMWTLFISFTCINIEQYCIYLYNLYFYSKSMSFSRLRM